MTRPVSVAVERAEPDLLGDPLGDEARAPVAERRPGRGVVEAIVADDQQAAIARGPGELGDDLEADLVGPLEVLEDEDRRPVEQLVDRASTMSTTSIRRRVRPAVATTSRSARSSLPSVAELRLPEGVAGQVEERRGGHVEVLGRDVPAGRPGTRGTRAFSQIALTRRVLPIPASPAIRSIWPRPSAASSRRRSARSSSSSRPTRSGLISVPTVDHRRRSVGRVRRRVIGHSTDDAPARASRRCRPSATAQVRRRATEVTHGQVHGCPLGVLRRHGRAARGRPPGATSTSRRARASTSQQAWLDPEAGKVFCLATGPSREAVLRIHERAGHPTSEIYELTVEV